MRISAGGWPRRWPAKSISTKGLGAIQRLPLLRAGGPATRTRTSSAWARRLEALDRLKGHPRQPHLYLSVSPAKFYGSGCRALANAGLLQDPSRSRVVIEKPFGTDYSSAQTLNRIVQSCGKESQIFRIDHYLGKETVQNIWSCASPTRSSSRSGTGITSPAFRSRPPKPLAWRNGPGTTNQPVPCGTWCRTT